MVRFVLIALLLLTFPVTFLGCASDGDGRQRLENEDLPQAYHRAHELENQAFEEIEKGNRRRHVGKRREHFDRAIFLLREARDLYENEMVERGGTPERQKNIEREMDRLSDEIEKLHKNRPRDELDAD